MLVYGSRQGIKHLKSKRVKFDTIVKIDSYSDLSSLDLSEALYIHDFEVIISIPKNEKSSFSSHCYYYSENVGIISSFPWWDDADKDIRQMSNKDIPCGTIKNPFDDFEQSWQILIFQKRDFVYVLQGSEPCCTEFEIFYKVDAEVYYEQWRNMIDIVKNNV